VYCVVFVSCHSDFAQIDTQRMSLERHKLWKLKNCPVLVVVIILISLLTTSDAETSNRTLGDKVKDGVNEVVHLSPVALTIIIGPIIGLFVLGIICYCICCKVRRMNRQGTSNFAGITVLKAPPGQPAPIPLTGMVNQPPGGFPKLAVPPTMKNGDRSHFGNGSQSTLYK